MAFSPTDKLSEEQARSKMMVCAKYVKTFLTANKMKQDDDKTEFPIMDNSCQIKYVQYNHINICNAQVNSTEEACNLGVINLI